MRRALPLALVVALTAAALAGCGSSTGRAAAPTSSPADQATRVVAVWKANLRRGARANPRFRFHNLTRAAFDSRLRRAASRYRFRVVEIRFLHPRQAAPLVVVETQDEQALARSAHSILAEIDPKADTGGDRSGWAFEGFLFEARDARGVPFLAAFNWWRGPHAGGGQWAAEPALYPFPHG